MAVPPLEVLVSAGFDVAGVVTRIDKRRGRGSDLAPSPVKAAAQRLGLPVVHTVDEALSFEAELGVVVAFGQLVKPHVLAVLPMVNLHFSLLPRWRGAAPVERAFLAGDDVTGVCLMQLEAGLDSGAVFDRAEVAIGADITGDELRRRLVDVGTELLVRSLITGLGTPTPQQGEPTYAAKISSAELRLDWTRPAVERHRVVRLGGAWTTFRDKRLKVVAAELVDPAATGSTAIGGTDRGIDGGTVGGLRLVTVQPEGKAPMPWRDFANGNRPRPDEVLV